MGHHDLRHDNECQNCGYTVEVEYCSKCGQKNTETRQSFTHLAGHFVEDLTHYDGAFWKTLKYLIFRPGKLTIEYLEGHRMRYVPPVKLYIFVSFVTFLLISLLPKEANIIEVNHNNNPSTQALKKGISFDKKEIVYHSVKEYDSIQNSLPEDQKSSFINSWGERLTISLMEKNWKFSDIGSGFMHILPKVLFIYMPIFAFWLWLFHGKKRWLFFDHGIYTLHYFTFLLIITSISLILAFLLSFINNNFTNYITLPYIIITLVYSIFYFFRSHSKMYGERKAISRLKVILLFLINLICISLVMAISFVYVVINTH